ncbi:MAG TPA: class I SAM-dependent methyltransferase [Vicinamibacteria bacterium]|nr:class I SAM-dependent methyltransferase [Vicinamibacteria bacterium]
MSRERLDDHRRLWQAKPVLRDVYAVWFDALLESLLPAASVLEVGAGPGFLAAHARERPVPGRWIAADLVPAPWNDLAADATRLPFPAAAFDAIAAVDLVHHLDRPAAFFEEARRVLRGGGRIVAVEPWVTPLSFPVYRWLHQEGCRPGLDPWRPFGESAAGGKDPFQGDAAVVWSQVRKTGAARWHALGFEAPRVTVLNGFAYLPTLGFRSGSLVPRRLLPLLIGLDRVTAPLARWTGLRALVVWRRRD